MRTLSLISLLVAACVADDFTFKPPYPPIPLEDEQIVEIRCSGSAFPLPFATSRTLEAVNALNQEDGDFIVETLKKKEFLKVCAPFIAFDNKPFLPIFHCTYVQNQIFGSEISPSLQIFFDSYLEDRRDAFLKGHMARTIFFYGGDPSADSVSFQFICDEDLALFKEKAVERMLLKGLTTSAAIADVIWSGVFLKSKNFVENYARFLNGRSLKGLQFFDDPISVSKNENFLFLKNYFKSLVFHEEEICSAIDLWKISDISQWHLHYLNNVAYNLYRYVKSDPVELCKLKLSSIRAKLEKTCLRAKFLDLIPDEVLSGHLKLKELLISEPANSIGTLKSLSIETLYLELSQSLDLSSAIEIRTSLKSFCNNEFKSVIQIHSDFPLQLSAADFENLSMNEIWIKMEANNYDKNISQIFKVIDFNNEIQKVHLTIAHNKIIRGENHPFFTEFEVPKKTEKIKIEGSFHYEESPDYSADFLMPAIKDVKQIHYSPPITNSGFLYQSIGSFENLEELVIDKLTDITLMDVLRLLQDCKTLRILRIEKMEWTPDIDGHLLSTMDFPNLLVIEINGIELHDLNQLIDFFPYRGDFDQIYLISDFIDENGTDDLVKDVRVFHEEIISQPKRGAKSARFGKK